MKVFNFVSAPKGNSAWGEYYEVSILADSQDQAWNLLIESRPHDKKEWWDLVEELPAQTGIIFSTQYTLGF